MEPVIKLVGAPQSPYSRKMRAALRYRRIPYQWLRQHSPASQAQPVVKISHMIPVLWFSHEDASQDTAMLDSTFQLQELEKRYTQRSLICPDPVVMFFNYFIEDFADEWLTKAMFHYRWSNLNDIEKAATILPLESKWNRSDEEVLAFQNKFRTLQTSRLGVVGSNDITKPLIEESFKNILLSLNNILTSQPFIMGGRPGAADFALYGQLACLALFDPSASHITLTMAPRVYAWVEAMEDTSGEEVNDYDWITRCEIHVKWAGLLTEIGRTYVPYLLANEKALKNNEHEFQCLIDGRTWQQKPFLYQGKCLHWLREAFNALNSHDKELAFVLLKEFHCEALVVY
jgi:glutathione S-transferase